MRRAVARLSIIALAFGFLIVGCDDVPEDLQEGKRAPLIRGETARGESVKLSDFRGKVVLLDFWATSCVPCLKQMPHYAELTKKYEGRPFTVLGVANDYDAEAMQAFLDEKGYDWPNILDGQDHANHLRWEIYNIPTLYIVDAEGVIRHSKVKYWETEFIDQSIEELVREAESASVSRE